MIRLADVEARDKPWQALVANQAPLTQRVSPHAETIRSVASRVEPAASASTSTCIQSSNCLLSSNCVCARGCGPGNRLAAEDANKFDLCKTGPPWKRRYRYLASMSGRNSTSLLYVHMVESVHQARLRLAGWLLT